jgi:uncharacterized protein YbjT (DUF2867 family)
MGARKAILIGATGLVGRRVLERLLADGDTERVTVFARRGPPRRHDKLDWRESDMSAPARQAGALAGDEFYCCFGTTIKKAGSREAFRRIDLEIPLAWTRAARDAGTRRSAYVSSVGADIGARAFYLATKGEVERGLRDLRLPFLGIFRPSLLLGDREELRIGERVAEPLLRALSPLMVGSLRRFRPIEADAVAAGMIAAVRGPDAGVRIYEYAGIRALARRSPSTDSL